MCTHIQIYTQINTYTYTTIHPLSYSIILLHPYICTHPSPINLRIHMNICIYIHALTPQPFALFPYPHTYICIHIDLCLYTYVSIHTFKPVYTYIYMTCTHTLVHLPMGWLRLVGSLKLYVSFAKEPHKRDYILQKRPIILRSLLIEATHIYVHI